MILEPGKYFRDVDELDMSGVALVSEGDENARAFKVVRVRNKSPAAEAGLRPQDIVLAIDGQAARDLTLSAIKDLFRRDGRDCSLQVKRDEEELTIRIKLKRQI
jgi:C-terminal processing protease CtpA/Prc